MKDNTTALHPPAVAVEDLLFLSSSMVTKYIHTPLDVRRKQGHPDKYKCKCTKNSKAIHSVYHLPIPTPNDDPMTMTVEDIFWDNVAM